MDRDKAMAYVKQLGFTSPTPLQLNAQPCYLTAREDMLVEGGGLGDAWTPDRIPGRKPLPEMNGKESAEPSTLLSSSPGDEKNKKVQNFAMRFIALSVHTDCGCLRKSNRSPVGSPSPREESRLTADTGDADSDSSSDEVEGVSLDKLLLLLGRLHSRPCPQAAVSPFVRLAACFSTSDSLNSVHVKKLTSLLASEHEVVRGTCLKVVERLLAQDSGRPQLLQSVDLVDRVMDLAQDTAQGPDIQVTAMRVLDKMLNTQELDYQQIHQRLDTEVYPSMLQCLHGSAPLDVKYAACCIVRTLARHAHFAARVKRESLFVLRQLQYSSARLKEAYVGVLMAVCSHQGLTDAGSMDTKVLPVLKGLLKDGPCEIQRKALDLVLVFLSDDTWVQAVAQDHRMLAYVLACLLASKCRKVQAQASQVLSSMSSPKKAGISRSVLEAIGYYMTAIGASNSSAASAGGGGEAWEEGKVPSSYPVPAKNQAEAMLWHHLDCFLDSLAALLRSQGHVNTKLGELHSELPVRGEVSGVQLTCLTHLLQTLVGVSTWPLHRRQVGGTNTAQITPLDITQLADDIALRERFSGLNHTLAVQQWWRFGHSVVAILRWMSQCIASHIPQDTPSNTTTNTSRLPPSSARSRPRPSSALVSRPKSALTQASSRPSSAKPSGIAANVILSDAELHLVHALLSFVLCMSLVTCKKLADPWSNDDTEEEGEMEEEAQGKKTARGVEMPQKGLWVKDNPHLTQSRGSVVPSPEDRARKQLQEAERKAASDRKKLRRDLYNQGLFQLLVPFLHLSDYHVKAVCCLILRTSVQPLKEWQAGQGQLGKRDGGESSKVTSLKHTLPPSGAGNRRPQSALAAPGLRQTDKQLNRALHQRSTYTAAVVKQALGSHPNSAFRPPSEMQASQGKSHSSSSGRCESRQGFVPLVAGQPVSRECQREAAVVCGGLAIHCLFCKSRPVKLYSLVFLYDLVRFSSAAVHMELSKYGIIPKLLDFIRVFDDDEQLEVLALRTVGVLVASDLRLKQLFSHHGGHTLLSALTRTTSPTVSAQVRATLATVSSTHRTEGRWVKGLRQRPSSAPDSRRQSCPPYMYDPPRDVWEQIMQRWDQEDKVVKVLQKFI